MVRLKRALEKKKVQRQRDEGFSLPLQKEPSRPPEQENTVRGIYSCQLTGSRVTWEMGLSGHALPYHFDMRRPILMVDQELKTI